MLTLRRLIHLLAFLSIVVRDLRAGMLTVAYGRTMLGGSGSLCGHLQLANLSLG
jgi:hypothetical protein